MKNAPFSFYWYDYETFGIDPALDRPAQFAGLRTDAELNPIGEPLLIYNRLSDDYLPDPDACLITGISPDTVSRHGVHEREFIAAIVKELSQPGTCNVGYNNIRFDDEFTRHTLFRNFHDPYSHEWRNDNSRWDLLEIVRMTRALRPDGIQWPFQADEPNRPSNRLEDLTRVNGIEHSDAHDALADVEATIAVARLIRQQQPKLFDWALSKRRKDQCRELLLSQKSGMVVHVSGMIPGEQHHLTLITPLCQHPGNSNGQIVFNLRFSPDELIELAEKGAKGIDQIRQRLFSKTDDLPAGADRLPLKTVHLNRAPVLAPIEVLSDADVERLELDKQRCEKHYATLSAMDTDTKKLLDTAITKAFAEQKREDPENVDATLYSGAFFTAEDKKMFAGIQHSDATALGKIAADTQFNDARLNELLFRYRARQFGDSLNTDDTEKWQKHCQLQLENDLPGNRGSYPRSLKSFKASLQEPEWLAPDRQELRGSLLSYAGRLAGMLGKTG